MTYGAIEIRGAREHNLKDVTLDVPKRQLTVFTGVSGSGKSSLVFGTIAAESQRLLNETHSAFIQSFLPRQSQPDADSLANLSAAIVVDQHRLGGNTRSTVGTVTDTQTMLRVLYSRLGRPAAGSASAFSFNDPQGMCPDCEGVGRVDAVDVDALVDRDRSLNEGAIRFPGYGVDTWPWRIFVQSGFFDNDRKLRDYSAEEWEQLLHRAEGKVKVSEMNLSYEGLVTRLRRSVLSKDLDQLQPHIRTAVEAITTRGPCPACGGSRLNAAARASLIDDTSIAECAAMEVSDLAGFVRRIEDRTTAPMVAALAARLDELTHIGLGYLSLDRPSGTLSGGESQRVKMVRHLGSSLTDITYVFDEPSVGLHAHDVHRLNDLLRQLRDKGNTVLVVEHEPEVMAIADRIVDLGPGAGRDGGQIVYQGDVAGLVASGTATGSHLGRPLSLKTEPRSSKGELGVEHATLHNLRDVTVSIPQGVLTVVTGVAGSGKSSLVLGCLPQAHPEAVVVDQRLGRGSKRSNPATFTGMLDHIRKAFAKANGVNAALFSANSKGACANCGGLGTISTDLAHLDPVVTVCEVCEGRRFTDEVLGYTLRGLTISDVFGLPVTEAAAFFTEEKALRTTLQALRDVGLGYLTLGQPLDTLSGGERQRLKLAADLGSPSPLYLLDEPTTGLHMRDVDDLVRLLDRLVDSGSTVVVIEHDLAVIARADWIIDLGPGAGRDGGAVVFEGPPAQLVDHPTSVTARYLRQRVSAGGAV